MYGEDELGGRRHGKSNLVSGLLVIVLLVIGGVEMNLGKQLEQLKIDPFLACEKSEGELGGERVV